jgi:hypothetical protein
LEAGPGPFASCQVHFGDVVPGIREPVIDKAYNISAAVWNNPTTGEYTLTFVDQLDLTEPYFILGMVGGKSGGVWDFNNGGSPYTWSGTVAANQFVINNGGTDWLAPGDEATFVVWGKKV